MFNDEKVREIRNRIFNLVHFTYDGTIEVVDFNGVKVTANGDCVTLGASSPNELARAFFLFAMEKAAGKSNIDIVQKPVFDRLGVMLSVQYPMKPEAVVNYMEIMAALGYNYLLMYMETSYEVKAYPFFGYMRGRYTPEELKYIDNEGAKLGIEVIPCIQTFGHMTDYLRWPAATAVKDNAECLLADCEETYTFIEAMISTVSSIFKSRRIHIGFDETRGMGLGRYLINHDYPDRTELFCRHLDRVKAICEKYNLSPLMWSDMPFRLGGDGYSDEYDAKSVIPPRVSEATANVGMCFWDYYNVEYEPYDKTLKRHLELFPDSDIIFSGASWVLDNHIMNMPHTLRATIPALEACIDNHIRDVNATIWGNASNTNLEQSLPGLAIFSEYCYMGKQCTKDDIYKVSEFATGLSRRYIEAISEFHLGYKNSLKLGSRLIWCDVLFELMRFNLDYARAKERLQKALDIINEEKGNYICPKEYAQVVFKIAIMKCDVLGGLRKAYKSGDTDFMQKTADEYIPALIPLYEKLSEYRTSLWMMGTKPFGVEKLQIQYAGIIARLKFAQSRIKDYLAGTISQIEELEQEILDEGYVDWLDDSDHYIS